MNTFYEPNLQSGIRYLSKDESKHCAQVLRHASNDEIRIVDGKGVEAIAVLVDVNKNKCSFKINKLTDQDRKPFKIHLGIAPTKSVDRVEWMMEKLCEIGVDEITFLQTEHSERKKLRIDRLEKKAISALKQSQNLFKIQINDLTSFTEFKSINADQKWIAHVSPQHQHLSTLVKRNQSTIILIGPEGDFSTDELMDAKNSGFVPVSLGKSTLRTETAGLLACHLVNVVNQY